MAATKARELLDGVNAMPRRKRRFVAGEVYHVVNRGNDKRVIFAEDDHFDRFLELLVRGRSKVDVEIVGFSVMSTHFHLLLRPGDRHAIPRFMHWVSGLYAVDFRARTGTTGFGHVFQRRYFAKAVEDQLGWLTVLGYIEMNALESGAVTRAENWPWCSLYDRGSPRPRLGTYDFPLPSNWIEMVNQPWEQFLASLVLYDLESRRRWRLQ